MKHSDKKKLCFVVKYCKLCDVLSYV